MEAFYFERPSMRRKNDIVDYINEFTAYQSEINGSGSLDKIREGSSFEQALERCLRLENEEYAASVGRCPGKTFLFLRRSDDKLIGTINVRWKLNEPMLRFGGHIGYAIRPTERRKGCARLILYMGLQEALKLGLERVMLGCDVKNIGSDKCIRALGGVLERCELDPYDGMLSNIYWIDVKASLETYRSVYEPLIVDSRRVQP